MKVAGEERLLDLVGCSNTFAWRGMAGGGLFNNTMGTMGTMGMGINAMDKRTRAFVSKKKVVLAVLFQLLFSGCLFLWSIDFDAQQQGGAGGSGGSGSTNILSAFYLWT